MPTYQYHCQRCQQSFEVQARMSDAAPERGPNCPSNEGGCPLQKTPSRVYGYVAGAKAPSAPQERPGAATAASSAASESAAHICSKYCDLHGRSKNP